MERVTIQHGELLSEPSCQLIALPCSTAGTARRWVRDIVRDYGLREPPDGLAAGSLDGVQISKQKAFVYAASVDGDGSSLVVVESIGRALGDLTRRSGFGVVGAPLFGAGLSKGGVERVPPRDAFDALERGFLWAARPDARLVVLVPQEDRIALLKKHRPLRNAAAHGIEIPTELVDRISRGGAVFFAGGGFDIQSGYPAWRVFLADLLRQSDSDGNIDFDRDRLEKLVAVDPDLVAEVLIARRGRDWFVDALARAYAPSPSYSELHQLAADLPFAGIVYAGWSSAIEQLVGDRSVIVEPSPANAEAIPRLLSQLSPFLVKLWGTLSRPETVSLTHEEYRQQLRRNELFARFLAHLATTQTMLFTLSSIARVEAFFAELPLWDARPGVHFAYFAQEPDAQAIARAERLRARYGVHSIFYTPTSEYPEAAQILRSIESRLAVGERTKRHLEAARIDGVRLMNIGPFEDLDLTLDAGWNVLLGNNGCGKSTILRAIALGFCGADPKLQDAAGGLLRAGASTGSIELRSGSTSFRTSLVLEGGTVRVRSAALTPLQTGRAVVLGFPALRGTSSQNPTGPTAGGSRTPEVADLLPLLRGGVDHRLDGAKQWIVNTQVRAEPTSQITPTEALRYARQRDAYFRILDAMTPGVAIAFDHVEIGTWRVMVRSSDGVVPIDALSQGTNSILGWVGTLLQRMFEIHPDADEPEKEPALVLVDEVDAHMHPEWQRLLVPLLRTHFPKLQVIATTHSPLIIGSLEASEVRHVRRDTDDGSVRVEPLAASLKGYRADQILTSPAFNLETTVSPAVSAALEEYRVLFGKSSRTAAEEDRFRTLRAELQEQIPSYPETPEARAALAATETSVKQRLMNQAADEKAKSIAAAEALLEEMEGES